MKSRAQKQAQNETKTASASKSAKAPLQIQQEFDFENAEGEPQNKAIYYGELEIIPTIGGDCYILDDCRCVMSENGFARLLGVDSKLLNRIRTNWPPKTLESFCNKDLTIITTLAEVTAKKCPYSGRNIVVYDVPLMEEIIRTYALAYANGCLRRNQLHLGETCADLLKALIKMSLSMRIELSCGLQPRPQQVVRRCHWDTIHQRARNLLYAALKLAYPYRNRKKYRGLMANCFGYVYKAFLGKKLYQEILQQRDKKHAVHQYIQDNVLRRRCVGYILMLANVIAGDQCRISAAKDPGWAAVQKLIAVQTPGMVAISGKQQSELIDAAGQLEEMQAVYYGQVNIAGKSGDGYILQDGSVGLSENALAIFIGMRQQAMFTIGKNGLPQKLRQFLEPEEQIKPLLVKVVAANSPYRGRYINFYPVADVEMLLRAYAFAFLSGKLQKNQRQIGSTCLQLVIHLARWAFEVVILDACGVEVKRWEAMQREFRKGLLEEERQLLLGAVAIAYPKLSQQKRHAIVASAFRFGYKDVLDSEERSRINGKSSPLHQHIEAAEIRNKLSRYLLVIAGQMVLGAGLRLARQRARIISDDLEEALEQPVAPDDVEEEPQPENEDGQKPRRQ